MFQRGRYWGVFHTLSAVAEYFGTKTKCDRIRYGIENALFLGMKRQHTIPSSLKGVCNGK